MKKLIAVFLTFVMCLYLAAGAFAEGDNPALEEGYTETGDGWISKVSWCMNGDERIYGEFYFPADYEEGRQYPVVIMSHGFMSTHAGYEKGEWAQMLSQQGYIGYIYDYRGGSKMSRSDGAFENMTVLTAVSDLNSVLDFVMEKEFCDWNNIYLFGSSMGGFVSALTAAQRNDDLAGMILLYPGFFAVDAAHGDYPTFEDIPEEGVKAFGQPVGRQFITDVYNINVMEAISGFTKDVLIIQGTRDAYCGPEYVLEAIDTVYGEAQSELVLLTGKHAVHAFDGFHPEMRYIAHDIVKSYMEKHVASEG